MGICFGAVPVSHTKFFSARHDLMLSGLCRHSIRTPQGLPATLRRCSHSQETAPGPQNIGPSHSLTERKAAHAAAEAGKGTQDRACAQLEPSSSRG